MKKLIYILGIIFCQFLSHPIQLSAQSNSLVLNGAFIVLDNGVAANNINLVIDQSNPLGIVRLSPGGHINSENQFNIVKWLTGSTIGSYVFPFGVGGNAADYIPFIFNKTAGNNNVSVSTWGTNVPNNPKPVASNVGSVTNMIGVPDSVKHAIDRFWDIQAPATTADLTFSYRGSENTTISPTSLIFAQHWNGTTWDPRVGPGISGVTAGVGTSGTVTGQTTFSPWAIIICPTTTGVDTIAICQNDSVFVGGAFQTAAGTYIDTLFNGNYMGCDSIVKTTVEINPLPTPTITPVSPLCSDASSVTLVGTPTGGAFSGTGVTGTSFDPATASVGPHIITYAYTDENGCSASTTTSITVTAPPEAGSLSGTQNVCSGSSVTITNTGGDTGGTWTSNNTSVATVSGGVVQGISGGTATISYTVVGTGGCSDDIATIDITVTPTLIPEVSISGDDVTSICSGSTVNLTANPTNGGSNPTYQWQINGTNVTLATGSTFSTTGLNDGDVITVVMVSNEACANPTTISDASAPVGIVNNVTPSVSISGIPTSEICAGADITFTANPNYGGANPTYKWQVNGVVVPGQIGVTFTTSTLDSGDVVSVVMFSNDPCAISTTVSGDSGANGIIIGDSESPIFSNCPNDTIVSSGNSCDVNVSWIPPTITDNCSTSPTLTSTYSPGDDFVVGTTLVTYYAEDEVGNIDSCSFNITVVDDEDPQILGCISDTILYYNSSSCGIILPNFTSSNQLNITDNCGSVSTSTITITQSPNAGTQLGVGTQMIWIIATDEQANKDSCLFYLTVKDTIPPNIDIELSSTSYCDGEDVSWTADITDNCQIDTIISNHQSGDNFPVGITTVNYTVKDINGNESNYSFDVEVLESPKVSITLGKTYSVCAGDPVKFTIDNPIGNYTYSWSYGGNEIANGPDLTIDPTKSNNNGEYTVTGEDSMGCKSGASINLTVKPCGISISGAISPNHDGKNDKFVIDELYGYPNTEVWIYNRWGAEVYHSDDYQNDWEGTSESSLNIGGNKLPEGTYYYIIKLGGAEGQPNAGEIHKGYVYLKR